jgi:hypothetical protein
MPKKQKKKWNEVRCLQREEGLAPQDATFLLSRFAFLQI